MERHQRDRRDEEGDSSRAEWGRGSSSREVRPRTNEYERRSRGRRDRRSSRSRDPSCGLDRRRADRSWERRGDGREDDRRQRRDWQHGPWHAAESGSEAGRGRRSPGREPFFHDHIRRSRSPTQQEVHRNDSRLHAVTRPEQHAYERRYVADGCGALVQQAPAVPVPTAPEFEPFDPWANVGDPLSTYSAPTPRDVNLPTIILCPKQNQ